jgi:hypothetical protein
MTTSKGSPLSEPERNKLKKIVDRDGVAVTAKRLGCSEPTLTRALSGLGVYRGTASLVRHELKRAKV